MKDGIPEFVLIDAQTGKMHQESAALSQSLTQEMLQAMAAEKQAALVGGKAFGEKLLKANGEVVNRKDALKDKKRVAVYVSGKKCGPCQQFTPVLAKWYKERKPADTEVILFSGD